MTPTQRPRGLMRRLRAPRFIRLLALSTALGATALLVISARWAASVSYTTRDCTTVEAALQAGLVEIWWSNRRFNESMAVDDERLAHEPGVAASVFQRGDDGISLAWRPFHTASSSFPRASDYHAVSIPLWLLVVPALLGAGYAHGVVVGARRAAGGTCERCSYSRAGLAADATCPECGRAPIG